MVFVRRYKQTNVVRQGETGPVSDDLGREHAGSVYVLGFFLRIQPEFELIDNFELFVIMTSDWLCITT